MVKKIIIMFVVTYFLFFQNNFYQEESINVMHEMGFNKTFEVAKGSDFYLEEFKELYKQIEYQEEGDFIEHVNSLLKLGYSAIEINNIYEFLNANNRQKLMNISKVNLEPYYKITNFEVDKIGEYEEYQKIHNCSLEEAVLKVNIGLNHDFYTEIETISSGDSYTVLVNKYHSLGDYEPSDLEPLSYDSKYKLRKEVRDAFEKMVSAARLENIFIRPYSAYRSYTYQESLYQKYVLRDGNDMADTYSARPGHSEHQTGLAVDVWSEGYQNLNQSEAKWLQENAFKYGFIVRYTKENINITGYIEEPWHLRYLGVDIASDVVEKNLTYDEYYDLYLK